MELATWLLGVLGDQIRANDYQVLILKVEDLLRNLVELKHNLSLGYFLSCLHVDEENLVEATDQDAVELMKDFDVLDLAREVRDLSELLILFDDLAKHN